MNSDIQFLYIEWRTPNFDGHSGLRVSVIFLDSDMYGFLFIYILASSQTLVVNWWN